MRTWTVLEIAAADGGGWGIVPDDGLLFARTYSLEFAQLIADALNEKEARDASGYRCPVCLQSAIDAHGLQGSQLKPGEALQLRPGEDWCPYCRKVVLSGHRDRRAGDVYYVV